VVCALSTVRAVTTMGLDVSKTWRVGELSGELPSRVYRIEALSVDEARTMARRPANPCPRGTASGAWALGLGVSRT
jgi:hypothetical protein